MATLHTYSICAYGESAFLEDCIRSVLDQKYDSQVIICTSTPNECIRTLGERYKLSLFINDESLGIASDWDFALQSASTPLVTIAHQDDIYCPQYSSKMVELFEQNDDALILFSDYGELRGDERIDVNLNLRIKRMLLKGLRRRGALSSTSEKLGLLRFGSPISCPAVTYNMQEIKVPLFDRSFKCSIDWRTWEQLSHQDGAFCFCPEILMYHRIHEDSETSASISNNVRITEDYEMFLKFWPRSIAKLLTKAYSISLKSNN